MYKFCLLFLFIFCSIPHRESLIEYIFTHGSSYPKTISLMTIYILLSRNTVFRTHTLTYVYEDNSLLMPTFEFVIFPNQFFLLCNCLQQRTLLANCLSLTLKSNISLSVPYFLHVSLNRYQRYSSLYFFSLISLSLLFAPTLTHSLCLCLIIFHRP